jgi:hypothetical protein
MHRSFILLSGHIVAREKNTFPIVIGESMKSRLQAILVSASMIANVISLVVFFPSAVIFGAIVIALGVLSLLFKAGYKGLNITAIIVGILSVAISLGMAFYLLPSDSTEQKSEPVHLESN